MVVTVVREVRERVWPSVVLVVVRKGCGVATYVAALVINHTNTTVERLKSS